MSRIEAAYEESDQRRFWVPCPICREFQVLKFAQLRWPKGEPEKAVYVCEHCGQEIQNHQKQWMLPRGQWRATARGDGKTAGFHLSSLYSPVGWFAWADAAKQFEQAQKNSVAAPGLRQHGAGRDVDAAGRGSGLAEALRPARVRTRSAPVPRGGLFLIAGADVQKDRIEVEVVA